jgi:Asp-tRNA(Asn)/Glu-tRNA(Gln) amidotransferase A subunit family amidase
VEYHAEHDEVKQGGPVTMHTFNHYLMRMSFSSSTLVAVLLAAPGVVAAQRPGIAPGKPPFEVTETTIADIHAAMRAGTLSCHELVSAYLARIAAYDRNGPAINSLIVVNPKAMAVADSLDRHAASGGAMGALHCVPMIVKDNFETKDLPTTAGSLSLQGLQPAQDAFMVRRLREAGAIVLAKSNMAEFAFTPYETVSSILPGYTKNPYALDRVTAGSSGGSAAAVAASLGEAALGTDTGNSIRGPSSHQALVGIRSTMGLTSRDGVAPLNLAADIAGPMARSVADAVAIFQVVAGEDAADTVTARSRGHRAADYNAYLKRDALRGARIGVLHQAYERDGTDPEVLRVFDAALDDMRGQGATIVDPVAIAELDEHLKAWTGSCNQFKHDIEEWLARQGSRAPVHTVAEIIKSRRFHPSIRPQLEAAQAESLPPARNPGCRNRDELRALVPSSVTSAMDSLHLDALVYPTWSNAPRLIGDLNTPAGDNSQLFSPSTGFPAITVPMGYTHGQLPAGMTLFGRAWSEPVLISLAYAYEQGTRWRRAPATVPPMR